MKNKCFFIKLLLIFTFIHTSIFSRSKLLGKRKEPSNACFKFGVCIYRVPKKIPKKECGKMDARKIIGRFTKVDKYWHKVWDRCNLKCYSRNNFYLLKEGIITEINLYRKLHKAKELSEHHILQEAAQRRAEVMARYKYVTKDANDTTYGQTYGVTYISTAPLIARQWYDQIAWHKLPNNNNYVTYDMFRQLVWQRTFSIGCGAAANGDFVYICCKFFPKGNLLGQARSNVLMP